MRALTGAAALLMLPALLAIPASGRSLLQKKKLALAQFETAEKMREALNGSPPAERTRRDYNRVTAAYRKVYYLAPTSRKANESALAVAELLAEMGRNFHDPKASRDSIAQYEFLMREYPGNPHRAEALFTIGKINQDDLDNGAGAKKVFQDFLKQHPRHRLSAAAQQAIDDIDRAAQSAAIASKPESGKKNAEVSAAETKANAAEKTEKAPFPSRGKLPLVTGIRHWSTADYTRVAIDLDDQVQYQAGRIASPERIFFDLRGTKLASDLAGKSFDVDDGFLRKIRVAQYQRGLTRVVLEVDPVSDYSAFMLPNPYRLIIDIHGRQPAKKLSASVAPGSAAAEKVAPSPSTTPEKMTSIAQDKRKTAANSPATAKTSAGASLEKENDKGKAGSGNLAPASALTKPARMPDGMRTAATTDNSQPQNSGLKNAGAPRAAGHPASAEIENQGSGEESAISQAAPDSEKKQAELQKQEAELQVKEAAARPTTRPTTAPTFQSLSPRPAASPSDEVKTIRRKGGKATSQDKDKKLEAAAREARPTSAGERSLVRALGLKIGKIVVDAGHGGHDTGTIGPHGLLEKDLVLDVAARLGKLLESRLGAEVIYTREDDTFVPLETRTAVANQNQADLFISIHANSSRDPAARGVETYYLNFTSSADALEVAARENAVSEKSVYELQDLVKKIALKDKMEESREFAGDVQSAMRAGLSTRTSRMRDRGVKKAPFIVLIGANMPSILAEISFVSNPGDERRLQTPQHRQKIAESLYRGIAKYAGGLSGVKLAAKAERPAGQ